MEEKTLGEKRVRVEFNESKNTTVDLIKSKFAELINLMQALKNDEVSKTYSQSPEIKEEISGEKLRLISIAQTSIEESAMWAVKAATSE